MTPSKSTSINTKAVGLFMELFCETFGPEKTNNLYIQYPFEDIYKNNQYIDFALENHKEKVAIFIEDGFDDYDYKENFEESQFLQNLLLKNSLVYKGWNVYRWSFHQLLKQPATVKAELKTFLGESPYLKEFSQNLPNQEGKSLELLDSETETLKKLQIMRENGETIAILYNTLGKNKHKVAARDAKAVGGNALFLFNTLKQATKACKSFGEPYSDKNNALFTGMKEGTDKKMIFSTVQTMSENLIEFAPEHFSYIVIDECHHAEAKTYRQILSYFEPKFILGLSSSTESADGEDMLELLQKVAQKMDLKTAVERNILAPVRCVRVKTDIDLTAVRIQGVQYHSENIESKLFLPERNKLLVDTYLNYVNGKKTVVFCGNYAHAQQIELLLKKQGICADSYSEKSDVREGQKSLENYENGNTSVLCVSDFLNDTWISSRTEVLFMAYPTMSKTIYMHQLRCAVEKTEYREELLVFDFVDKVNRINMPYSLHRMYDIQHYKPFEYVLAPESKLKADTTDISDIVVNSSDSGNSDVIEVVELYNWQKEAQNMLSVHDFTRMVDVQSETITRYITDQKIIPDLSIPISESRTYNYFNHETVRKYASEFNWGLITDTNIKEKFMDFVRKMDMSYSYKPVFLIATMRLVDNTGRAQVQDIVDYVKKYYQKRLEQGLVAEKSNSVFEKGGYTDKEVETLILKNPFKRFADMGFMKRDKGMPYIEINGRIIKELTDNDRRVIVEVCERKLEEYYGKMGGAVCI